MEMRILDFPLEEVLLVHQKVPDIDLVLYPMAFPLKRPNIRTGKLISDFVIPGSIYRIALLAYRT